MRLYDDCRACGTHKNAFYPYCPTCGVPAARDGAPDVPTPAVAGA
jgi:hypothetical protein